MYMHLIWAPVVCPKMVYNCAQKQLRFRPGDAKVEVQRAPGQVSGRLAPSWASWGGFGSVLEGLGSVVEESWAQKGGQHDSKLGARTAPE